MVLSLKQARLLSEKTQREMAEKLRICVDTYREIERHPERATINQAKMLSAITGRTVDEIFFG